MKLFNIEERPWPRTGLSTDTWKQIVPSIVLLKSLRCSQDTVDIAALLDHPTQSYCDDTFIHVINYNNELWIEDGHHRALKAYLSGDEYILARIYAV